MKKRLAGNGACDLTTSILSVNRATRMNLARSFTMDGEAVVGVPIALHQRDRTIRITVVRVYAHSGHGAPPAMRRWSEAL